jgi:hypothetical protein
VSAAATTPVADFSGTPLTGTDPGRRTAPARTRSPAPTM